MLKFSNLYKKPLYFGQFLMSEKMIQQDLAFRFLIRQPNGWWLTCGGHSFRNSGYFFLALLTGGRLGKHCLW